MKHKLRLDRVLSLLVTAWMIGCGSAQSPADAPADDGKPAEPIAAAVPTPRPTPSGPWPQWRGPSGLGVSAEAPLPTTWSPTSANLRWSTVIPGEGNSSPIVGRDQVFVTSYDHNGGRRLVLAYDLATGAQQWETVIPYVAAEKFHQMSTRAAPTPVTDGDAVYVYFGGVIAKLDRQGKLLWRQEVDPNYQETSHYGAANSLVLTDAHLIVLHDREQGEVAHPGWLGAFDRTTGEAGWRHEWMHTCCSYATPLVHTRDGKVEVIVAHSAEVVGYDALTGEPTWKHEHGSMIQICTSPVVAGDLLIVSGGIPMQHTVAYRLGGPEPAVLWHTHRSVPEVSSPVLHDGLFYALTKDSIMTCYDAETGELQWQERVPAGDYYGSLVIGDGKIYAVNNYGITAVVKTGREFELLAENRLLPEDQTIENSNASPAVGGGMVLLRAHGRLFAIANDGV